MQFDTLPELMTLADFRRRLRGELDAVVQAGPTRVVGRRLDARSELPPPSLRFARVTIKTAAQHNGATGGTLPAPLAFETVFENQNLTTDRPGSTALVFENIGRHRASSGVATANLQYKRSFAVVPALEVVHRYHGVICLESRAPRELTLTVPAGSRNNDGHLR